MTGVPVADGVPGLVGRTPLVRLRRLLDAPGGPRVFAKLESANPAGSAKDRPAAAMVGDALARGDLRPGGTIVESSSGNLGVALAQLARWHGLDFVCVVDPRVSTTNARLVEAYGGRLHRVTEPDRETGDWLVARQAAVRDLVESMPGAWCPDQYSNPLNPAAHAAGTAREILEALDGRLSALLVATSTTGTLAGCQRHLREAGVGAEVVAVDAVGSVLFRGSRAKRLLPGFGAGSVPPLAAGVEPDRLVRVDDLDCVVGCRRLARREALLAGASGGGVISALDAVAADYGSRDTVVVVLHDHGERYLETVYDDAWVSAELGCDPDRLEALVSRRLPASA